MIKIVCAFNAFRLFFVFFFSLLFIGFTATYAISGSSKKVIRSSQIPDNLQDFLPGIGVLRSGRSVCTAFCVSQDVIVTSQHCVQFTNERWRSSSMNFSFVVEQSGKIRKSPVWGRTAQERRQNIAFGLKRDGSAARKRNAAAFEADWALIRLKKRICRKVLPVESLVGLISRTMPGRDVAEMVSSEKFYRRARGKRWTYSGRCRFISSRISSFGAAIAHNCPAVPGTSGAPIFLRNDNGDLVVAAVNSGTFLDRSNGKRERKFRAIEAGAFADSLPHFIAHKRNLTTAQLRTLQEALKKQRLLNGRADGVFGPQTRLAIIKFEASIGYPELGLPTELIYDLLTGQKSIPSECWIALRFIVPRYCRTLGLQ